MANYLLVFHGGGMPETPEEGERIMKTWTDWFGVLDGALVDPGNPTGQTKTIANGSVTDGGGSNPASGYSVIKADSIDAAVALAKGCPILQGPRAGTVEVAEIVAM